MAVPAAALMECHHGEWIETIIIDVSVVGKSRNEVIASLGKVKATQSGELELWDYPDRTADPVTGKTDHEAQVEFEGDRVANVTFIRV